MNNKSREITLITGFLPKTTKNKQLFMQNKPNLLDAQMSVTSVRTRNYEDFRLYGCRKNKPNSKPKQTQSKPIKPYQSQFQTQNKPNQTQFQTRHLPPKPQTTIHYPRITNHDPLFTIHDSLSTILYLRFSR